MRSQKLVFVFFAVVVLKFTGWTAVSSATLLPNSYKTEKVDSLQATIKNKDRIRQMKLFVGMTADQYGRLRGKKLNFFEKLSFHTSQHRMKEMLKYYEYGDGPTTLQKISWLLKGLLLGPIALLLGYIFLKDDDRDLIKWIWFGFAGFAVIVTIILLSL